MTWLDAGKRNLFSPVFSGIPLMVFRILTFQMVNEGKHRGSNCLKGGELQRTEYGGLLTTRE